MLLLQNGLMEATSKSRKQIKERKNRTKKIRGVKKNAGARSVSALVRLLRALVLILCTQQSQFLYSLVASLSMCWHWQPLLS